MFFVTKSCDLEKFAIVQEFFFSYKIVLILWKFWYFTANICTFRTFNCIFMSKSCDLFEKCHDFFLNVSFYVKKKPVMGEGPDLWTERQNKFYVWKLNFCAGFYLTPKICVIIATKTFSSAKVTVLRQKVLNSCQNVSILWN